MSIIFPTQVAIEFEKIFSLYGKVDFIIRANLTNLKFQFNNNFFTKNNIYITNYDLPCIEKDKIIYKFFALNKDANTQEEWDFKRDFNNIVSFTNKNNEVYSYNTSTKFNKYIKSLDEFMVKFLELHNHITDSYKNYYEYFAMFNLANGIKQEKNFEYNLKDKKLILDNNRDYNLYCKTHQFQTINEDSILINPGIIEKYNKFVKNLSSYNNILSEYIYTNVLADKKERISNKQFRNIDNEINPYFRYNKNLGVFNLKHINFDNLDISHMNLSNNPEIKIDFSKIKPNLYQTSIRGINTNNFIFKNWDLRFADMRETNAIVDLSTCQYSPVSKVYDDTKFDNSVKFLLKNANIPDDLLPTLGIQKYQNTSNKKTKQLKK